MKLLILTIALNNAYANPSTDTIDLSRAFYSWDCEQGYLTVTSETHECTSTGLFKLTAKVSAKGRLIESVLKNDNPCESLSWTAKVPEVRCTKQNQNDIVKSVKVQAQVDAVLWKDVIDAVNK